MQTISARYELGPVIGRGGMAEVLAGRDTRLERPVAVKLLRADLGPGQEPVTTTDDFATSGHGLVWLTPTGPRHYLVVQSACSWHIKVLQAAT